MTDNVRSSLRSEVEIALRRGADAAAARYGVSSDLVFETAVRYFHSRHGEASGPADFIGGTLAASCGEAQEPPAPSPHALGSRLASDVHDRYTLEAARRGLDNEDVARVFLSLFR